MASAVPVGRLLAAPPIGVVAVFSQPRLVCGSGGVGKTTTAAALALQAARGGRRVLVCTIDPSRRLATSLGLGRLSGRPRAIRLGRRGANGGGGSLWAMVLDVKTTFDALVEESPKLALA